MKSSEDEAQKSIAELEELRNNVKEWEKRYGELSAELERSKGEAERLRSEARQKADAEMRTGQESKQLMEELSREKTSLVEELSRTKSEAEERHRVAAEEAKRFETERDKLLADYKRLEEQIQTHVSERDRLRDEVEKLKAASALSLAGESDVIQQVTVEINLFFQGFGTIIFF